MKKILRIAVAVLFGFFGSVYGFLALVVLNTFFPSSRAQGASEEEVGNFLGIFMVLGGLNFAVLWGWIGYTITRKLRQGLLRIAGAVIGTVINYFTAGLIVPLRASPGIAGLLYIIQWAVLAWRGAILFGKIVS